MEAGNRVRAEYDFDAQPNSGEMSIKAGETLTIIKGVRQFITLRKSRTPEK